MAVLTTILALTCMKGLYVSFEVKLVSVYSFASLFGADILRLIHFIFTDCTDPSID